MLSGQCVAVSEVIVYFPVSAYCLSHHSFASGGVHASGALVTVKQLGLQLVFCVEIISSPLLAQGRIQVLHHSHVFFFCWARVHLMHMHSFGGVPSSALSLFAKVLL